MKKSLSLLFSVLFILVFAAGVSAQTAVPGYDVVLRAEAPEIDGDLSDAVWAEVPVLNGAFRFPWEAVEAPATTFRSFSDGEKLYFMFSVTDGAVLAEDEWSGESTVDDEDRVELFFAAGPVDLPVDYALPLYYCIEVDPKGRTHDYSVKYYRDFDSEWSMAGLETAAALTETGYSIEGAVPLTTFAGLGLIDEMGTMKVGVFRAEFTKPADEIVMQWISWVDPKTPVPDFHVDSAFGEFRFLK